MRKFFENIGLNTKEEATYLKLLELGPQPISVLARHMHVPRPSMYVTIEKLKELLVIREFERNKIKYVQAISVDELFDLLTVKEQSIDETREILKTHEYDLRKLENRESLQPKVTYHEGREEVIKLYEHILKTEKIILAYFNPKKLTEALPSYYLEIGNIAKTHRTYSKELVVNSPISVKYKKDYSSLYNEIVILPEAIQFNSDTIITEDSVYMTTFGDNTLTAVAITNKELAHTFKVIFNELWEKHSK